MSSMTEGEGGAAQGGITVTGLGGKWRPEEPEPTLTDINMQAGPGQLTAIIGPVGSGKSSVVQVCRAI